MPRSSFGLSARARGTQRAPRALADDSIDGKAACSISELLLKTEDRVVGVIPEDAVHLPGIEETPPIEQALRLDHPDTGVAVLVDGRAGVVSLGATVWLQGGRGSVRAPTAFEMRRPLRETTEWSTLPSFSFSLTSSPLIVSGPISQGRSVAMTQDSCRAEHHDPEGCQRQPTTPFGLGRST